VNKKKLSGDDLLKASVTVTNTGKYAGEETVEMYISDPVASISRSVEDLKGFQKVLLQPGESKEVTFNITTDQLKFYNSNLVYDWEPGVFIVRIGPDSENVKSATVTWTK